MGLPESNQLAPWLTSLGGNVVAGGAAILIYGAIKALFERENRLRDAIAIGVIFGCAALMAMRLTIVIGPGIIIDTRNIFIMVGSLFGGPPAGVILTLLTSAYRLYIGGIGTVQGIVSIVLSSALGSAIAWRYGDKVRAFGFVGLGVIGLADAVLTIVWRQIYYTQIVGVPGLPFGAEIALLVTFALSALLLGTAMSMTHYRVWWQTQSRLSDLLNTASDLVWETDVGGHFTYASGRHLSVLGYRADELVGRPVTDFGSHWRTDEDRAAFAASSAARQPFGDLTSVINAKDGAQRIFLVYGVPMFDPRSRFLGYRGTATDITERERTLGELRDGEEQLRLIRDHLIRAQKVASVASTEVNLLTQEAYWSDHAYHLYGLDPKTAKPGPAALLTTVHPDDRDRVRDTVMTGRRGENTAPVEFRVMHPDGSVRWLRRVSEVIRDGAGVPVRVTSTVRDITEQKEAEAHLVERQVQLNRSREHLAIAQLTAKLGSVEHDFGSDEIYWSEEVYRILGVSPRVIPSIAQFRALVHPDDSHIFDRAGAMVRDGIDVEPGELRIIRPDNETRWILRSVRVFRDDAGRAVKSVATVQDITELKKSQSERLELERQLTQAQKMEAVGNLTGGVAHDFNNLLSVILGRLEIAEEELADRPIIRDWIRTCIKAANRGAALTRSMLAFSRQQALQPIDLDLGVVVGELMELLPRTLGETIQIKVVRAPDLWPCHADAAQVQNALLNLALNARDAMPGGGALTIETANAHLDDDYAARNTDLTAGDYVSLSVADTGSGMAPDVIARAFEPFFTTKEVGKGSGLGLSMVYGFVKQSGGHVRIYSEIGIGTNVQLYFPRSTAALAAAHAPREQWDKIANGETVLVVEDDEDMRALAITQLERLGYVVFAGTNATEGLDLVRSHPEASLLLTDITLPGGRDGRDMARDAVRYAPHLRVVYMSGYSESMIAHGTVSDAGIPLLQKPFSVRELVEKLRMALS